MGTAPPHPGARATTGIALLAAASATATWSPSLSLVETRNLTFSRKRGDVGPEGVKGDRFPQQWGPRHPLVDAFVVAALFLTLPDPRELPGWLALEDQSEARIRRPQALDDVERQVESFPRIHEADHPDVERGFGQLLRPKSSKVHEVWDHPNLFGRQSEAAHGLLHDVLGDENPGIDSVGIDLRRVLGLVLDPMEPYHQTCVGARHCGCTRRHCRGTIRTGPRPPSPGGSGCPKRNASCAPPRRPPARSPPEGRAPSARDQRT